MTITKIANHGFHESSVNFFSKIRSMRCVKAHVHDAQLQSDVTHAILAHDVRRNTDRWLTAVQDIAKELIGSYSDTFSGRVT